MHHTQNSSDRFMKQKLCISTPVLWLSNGDHPHDYDKDVVGYENGTLKTWTKEQVKELGWEGQIVRYYRRPDICGSDKCQNCGRMFNHHGWIEPDLSGVYPDGLKVCPGNFVVKVRGGKYNTCKPDELESLFTIVADSPNAENQTAPRGNPEVSDSKVTPGKDYPCTGADDLTVQFKGQNKRHTISRTAPLCPSSELYTALLKREESFKNSSHPAYKWAYMYREFEQLAIQAADFDLIRYCGGMRNQMSQISQSLREEMPVPESYYDKILNEFQEVAELEEAYHSLGRKYARAYERAWALVESVVPEARAVSVSYDLKKQVLRASQPEDPVRFDKRG